MIHEDAALTKHPKAKEFRPVKRPLSKELYGWTFEVPSDGANSGVMSFGWVTCDGEVSSDTLRLRSAAVSNLKSYMRSRTSKAGFSVEDAK